MPVRRFSLSLFCVLAFAVVTSAVSAQSPASPGQQTQAAPDDLRLILMIRNAVVALNQANITGNYSVLRDLGTPTFQQTNSSAKLAEAFATLRNRKIDISPVMFFPPKLTAQPTVLEGQVLRLTGFFATTPEQVNFDLAFQLTNDQWMLAAIAVNVAPPGEAQQSSAMSDAPRTSEAKPIRIDLTQPASPGAQPPQKKAPPQKKPKPGDAAAAQQPVRPAQSPQPSAPAPAPASPPAAPAQAEQSSAEPAPAPPPSNSAWNPFGR